MDGIEYPMLESDKNDTDFTDGKTYYFQIPVVDAEHEFLFDATDGTDSIENSI